MKVRVQPHLTAPDDVWSPSGWQCQINGTPTETVSNALPDFDYVQRLEIGYGAEINTSELRRATELAQDARVAAYLLVDCRASVLRTLSTYEFDLAGTVSIELWHPCEPGSLAGQVELHRGLVLVDPGSTSGGMTPTEPGARLLDERPFRISLEGDWGRFPIQAVDFAKSSSLPSQAAWMLNLRYDDPGDPFLAVARLRVNTAHPAGQAVLSLASEDDAWVKQCRSALATDIVRQLLQVASRDDRFDRHETDESETSLLRVVDDLAENLLQRPLKQVLILAAENPTRLDGMIQGSIGYLGEKRTLG